MRYCLTGEEFSAREALRMNVVALACPAGVAEATGQKIADTISRSAPLAVQAAMAQAQTWMNHGDKAALAHSVPDIIRLLNSSDAKEAMSAAMARRAPVFTGQ
jgi:enoyl-CoA hydratase